MRKSGPAIRSAGTSPTRSIRPVSDPDGPPSPRAQRRQGEIQAGDLLQPDRMGRARAISSATAAARAGKSVCRNLSMAAMRVGRSSAGSGVASAAITASTSVPTYRFRVITVIPVASPKAPTGTSSASGPSSDRSEQANRNNQRMVRHNH